MVERPYVEIDVQPILIDLCTVEHLAVSLLDQARLRSRSITAKV